MSAEAFDSDVAGGTVSVDPDPFAIGIAIFSMVVGGASWLEARRQRQFIERQHQDRFRAAWFEASRTLIHARRVVAEFATYVREDAYGNQDFMFGKVGLTLDPERAARLQRLYGNALTTANWLGQNLERLSEFVLSKYVPLIDQIHQKLTEQSFPHSYDALLMLATDTVELFERLIKEIGSDEGFSAQ